MEREYALKLFQKQHELLLTMILAFNKNQKQKRIKSFVEQAFLDPEQKSNVEQSKSLVLAQLIKQLETNTCVASKLSSNQEPNLTEQVMFFDFAKEEQRLLLLPAPLFNNLSLQLGFCAYSQSLIPFLLSAPASENSKIIDLVSNQVWLLAKNTIRYILGAKQNLQSLLPTLDLSNNLHFSKANLLSIFLTGSALVLTLFNLDHSDPLSAKKDAILKDSLLFRLTMSYQAFLKVLNCTDEDLRLFHDVLQKLPNSLVQHEEELFTSVKSTEQIKLNPFTNKEDLFKLFKIVLIEFANAFSSLGLKREIVFTMKKIISAQEERVCKAFFN